MTALHTEEFDVLLRDALGWLMKKKKIFSAQTNRIFTYMNKKHVGQNILLQLRLVISASNIEVNIFVYKLG